MKRSFEDALRAVVWGHAVGDALGVPVEFMARDELDASPVSGMTGYGTYPMPAGCFSDDTSMALAALDSLSSGKIDYTDVMERFADWYYEDAYTPTGELFDVGNTCARAIENYKERGIPLWDCAPRGERDNGNGALMRIDPFVLFASAKEMSSNEMISTVQNATHLTHGHRRARMASLIYAFVLRELLKTPTKDAVDTALTRVRHRIEESEEYPHFEHVFSPDFAKTPRDAIRSGGYVVDTLTAALWCLLTTDSYEDCVLRAVNLGDDTDTTAAVAGSLAGALYGERAIPAAWVDAMQNKELINTLCTAFAQALSE